MIVDNEKNHKNKRPGVSENGTNGKRKKNSYISNDQFWAYIFILPQFIGILCFTFFPAVAAFFLSFMKWDFIKFPTFVGLANVKEVVSDPLTYKVIGNTLYFIAGSMPITLVMALILALLLNTNIKGVVLFRTAFFLPAITSSVAVALVWSWLFNPDMGLINAALSLIGIPGPGWTASLRWAMPAIIIVSVWQWSGYNSVIFLAALKGIPITYLEAAEIDGAGPIRKFFSITLPLLTPSIFFLTIMMLINGMQVFNEMYMMTSGGPADATNVIVMQIYTQAFQFFNMGKASVLSMILFIICLTITLFQFKFQKKWVNYDI